MNFFSLQETLWPVLQCILKYKHLLSSIQVYSSRDSQQRSLPEIPHKQNATESTVVLPHNAINLGKKNILFILLLPCHDCTRTQFDSTSSEQSSLEALICQIVTFWHILIKHYVYLPCCIQVTPGTKNCISKRLLGFKSNSFCIK